MVLGDPWKRVILPPQKVCDPPGWEPLLWQTQNFWLIWSNIPRTRWVCLRLLTWTLFRRFKWYLFVMCASETSCVGVRPLSKPHWGWLYYTSFKTSQGTYIFTGSQVTRTLRMPGSEAAPVVLFSNWNTPYALFTQSQLPQPTRSQGAAGPLSQQLLAGSDVSNQTGRGGGWWQQQ